MTDLQADPMTRETLLRALAKRWGLMADRLVREPTLGKEARAYNDAKVTTLRFCEKELIEAMQDIRREGMGQTR